MDNPNQAGQAAQEAAMSKDKVKKKGKKFVIKTSFFKDLKSFLLRGNVIDLAVAVIIGAAFGKITTSLVADIIMPPIGLLIGGVNFADLVWVIKPAVGDAAAVTINYGNLLQAIIEFLIIGFTIFVIVRLMNRVTSIKFTSRAEAEAAAKAKKQAELEAKQKEQELKDKAEQAAQRAEQAELACINTEKLLSQILEQLKTDKKSK